jgi:hypothetical protein
MSREVQIVQLNSHEDAVKEADNPQQAPVRHHFTPVFYLSAWAVRGRVMRYYRPKDVAVASPIAPKNTGYENHLYTLQGMPPEQQEVLETQFFSPLDSRAAIAHKLLLAGQLKQLTNHQRVDWARFMMSMQLRSPFSLGEVKRLADHNLRANLYRDDPEYSAIRKPGEPGNIYDWTAKHQPHVLENAHKQFLPGLIDHEELGHYLVNMHWSTIDVSSSTHTLLTGDRSLIATHGWKDVRAVLLFPLSPHRLLAATNGMAQTAQVIQKSPTSLTQFTNNQIAGCAVNFVFGINNSHLRFVERRLRRVGVEPIPGPVGKGRPGCSD